ncbi:MAG: DUF177 domain-containing protein [Oscillospiraceae bacterium]
MCNAPGQRLPFQFSLDFSDLCFADRYPAVRPVEVEGEVRNVAGVMELGFVMHTTLDSVCDRCAKEFQNPVSFRFDCMLAEEKQDEENDEIVLLEQGQLDVGDLARTVFILEMDTKTLCSEDCKGLCPRCGTDLNLGPCSCQKEADPRLAVLAKLLDKDSDK